MWNPNVIPSDQIAVCDQLSGRNWPAATYTTAWIAAKDFAHFLALVTLANTAGSGTLDAKIQQATDDQGTGAKDVTGKAITQLTNESPSVDKTAAINLRPDELDLANGFDYFRLSMTVGTATVAAHAMVLGIAPRFSPAGDFDASDVVEVVS